MSDRARDPHADNISVDVHGERICIGMNISGVPERINVWLTDKEAEALAQQIFDAVLEAQTHRVKGQIEQLGGEIDRAGEALGEASEQLKKNAKFD